MSKKSTIIQSFRYFDNWVVEVLYGIFNTEFDQIFIDSDKKNINPAMTFEVGQNMLDSITSHLISVTSATSGFYHSHLVITHQLNKVFFQYFRKGNIPETETLTLSFEQRLSIWHDKGSQRKLYVSNSSIEIQQIFIFQLFLFYQISILQTKHIQVVIAKP